MCRALAIAVAAAAVLAIAGCGGGSSSTGTTPTTTASSGASPPPDLETAPRAATQPPGSSTSEDRGGHSHATAPNPAPAPAKEGNASVQGYGSPAGESDQRALEGAAFSFFKAMQNRDFPKVCEDLLKSNREQLQSYLKASHQAGTCSDGLERLLSSAVAVEARKALQGTVTGARIKEGNAFLLFRPKGGPLSFIVLKREDGAWHPTSLAPGTPLNPTAAGA